MVACLTLAVTSWLVGAPAVSAATYTFRQGVNGYSGASSTYTEYQPAAAQSYNYGGRASMLVYTPNGEDPPRKTGFMMFDLTSVESPVAVSSASRCSLRWQGTRLGFQAMKSPIIFIRSFVRD